jgi:hypothetical protein
MEGEDIIEAEYCMLELVDMALGQRIEPTSLDLTVETVNPLDVDERPPPIVKLKDAQQHAQLLATYILNGQFIRLHSRKYDEIAGHIGEAQQDICC